MKSRLLVAVLCMLAVQVSFAEAPVSAATASQQAVTVNLIQNKVIKDEKGIEKRIEASSVKPNDVIEYRVTYKNVTDKPVKGLIANLPIPDGLEYQASSAKPSRNAVVAAEDATYSREPLAKKQSDGTTKLVPYNEYRHVRWDLGTLAPGASVEVVARAKVEAFSAKTPALAAVKSTAK
ncbi:DUF11 domain-containing protein [Methylovorus glucosotrophus]|uniref:Uncharacterized protein n=1 Tax=Methylovorus glucosotrophus (strain SIP3-4) TaxID=582744 RepID=C6XB11_METGS|nr:DUF11 domain-containing protein [Methylovorus glucosotrophus]ACT51781.1 conserved hypothetical protein [Methylovorus glucosotrophus SIP3-4]KAF0842955.1 putative repeat protein (TIGR01451 family) [Methylovorus glucosotrophus]